MSNTDFPPLGGDTVGEGDFFHKARNRVAFFKQNDTHAKEQFISLTQHDTNLQKAYETYLEECPTPKEMDNAEQKLRSAAEAYKLSGSGDDAAALNKARSNYKALKEKHEKATAAFQEALKHANLKLKTPSVKKNPWETSGETEKKPGPKKPPPKGDDPKPNPTQTPQQSFGSGAPTGGAPAGGGSRNSNPLQQLLGNIPQQFPRNTSENTSRHEESAKEVNNKTKTGLTHTNSTTTTAAAKNPRGFSEEGGVLKENDIANNSSKTATKYGNGGSRSFRPPTQTGSYMGGMAAGGIGMGGAGGAGGAKPAQKRGPNDKTPLLEDKSFYGEDVKSKASDVTYSGSKVKLTLQPDSAKPATSAPKPK